MDQWSHHTEIIEVEPYDSEVSHPGHEVSHHTEINSLAMGETHIKWEGLLGGQSTDAKVDCCLLQVGNGLRQDSPVQRQKHRFFSSDARPNFLEPRGPCSQIPW